MTKVEEWRKHIALVLHHVMGMCANGAVEVVNIMLDDCKEIANGDEAEVERMLGAQAATLTPVMDIARNCDRGGTMITVKPLLRASAPITAVNVVYTNGKFGVTLIATEPILEGSPIMCCGGIQTYASEIRDGSQKQSWYHFNKDREVIKVTQLGSLASLLCSAWNGENNLTAYNVGETTSREVAWLYASKDISAGEQLSVDFGEYWNQHTYQVAKILPGQADPCRCINGSSPSASVYQMLHHDLNESMNVLTMHAMYEHMLGNASPIQSMYSSLFELSLHCIKNTDKDKLAKMIQNLQNLHQSIDGKSVHDVSYWHNMLDQAICMLDDQGALHELIKKLLKVAEEDLQQHSLSQQYMMADENKKLKETAHDQSKQIQQLKRVNTEMHVILRNRAETHDAKVQQFQKENDQLRQRCADLQQTVVYEQGKIKRAKRELE